MSLDREVFIFHSNIPKLESAMTRSELDKLRDLVTVVIPTLNEREAIGAVIDEVRSCGYTRIVVVDGGSTDGTIEIAKEKGVTVIMQEGRGKADAIATALKHVETPFMLVMDGDYTYPAKYIDELLAKAIDDRCDEVIGARLYGEGHSPIFRFGNIVLTKLFNFLFGTKLRDVLSGMYLVRVDAVRDMLFEMKGFSIESEIAAHIASTGGKICEVPIEYRKRLGKKKLGIRHGIKIALDMVRLAYRYNPVSLMLIPSLLISLVGLALLGYVAYYYLVYGVKYYVKALIGLILFALGAAGTFISLLSIYLKRMEIRIYRRIREIDKRLFENGR